MYFETHPSGCGEAPVPGVGQGDASFGARRPACVIGQEAARFSPDHLSLKVLRLRANEEWECPGKGFSFLFPTEGLGTYLVGPLAHLLNPGDVLVAKGDPKGRVGVRNGGELALWLFSVSFEHLYPLFASRELGLLAEVSENLKRTRLYGASTAVAREWHRLL